MGAVRVYFATNRNHQPENTKLVFGPRFNADGVAALRFGHVDFGDGVETLQGADVHVYEDVRSDAAPNSEPDFTKGGGLLLEGLRRAMCEGRDTLVFIHGFNVTFNEAMEAGARLARQVRIPVVGHASESRPVNIVVLSWPSDGAAVPFMSYYSDREDARASGPAVARAYFKLRDFLAYLHRKDGQLSGGEPSQLCNRAIHLLAHSMGCYVLRQGLQAILAKEAEGLVRVFDQILLASPDEDDDTFEYDNKMKPLPRLGKRVTVYFNPKDKALWISDKTKTNPDRLGADGPRLIDLLPKKVALVDCRRVAGVADPKIQHSYYVDSRAMTGDIEQVLSGVDIDDFRNRQWVAERRVWRVETELI